MQARLPTMLWLAAVLGGWLDRIWACGPRSGPSTAWPDPRDLRVAKVCRLHHLSPVAFGLVLGHAGLDLNLVVQSCRSSVFLRTQVSTFVVADDVLESFGATSLLAISDEVPGLAQYCSYSGGCSLFSLRPVWSCLCRCWRARDGVVAVVPI
jgi:hypothetical protein